MTSQPTQETHPRTCSRNAQNTHRPRVHQATICPIFAGITFSILASSWGLCNCTWQVIFGNNQGMHPFASKDIPIGHVPQRCISCSSSTHCAIFYSRKWQEQFIKSGANAEVLVVLNDLTITRSCSLYFSHPHNEILNETHVSILN